MDSPLRSWILILFETCFDRAHYSANGVGMQAFPAIFKEMNFADTFVSRLKTQYRYRAGILELQGVKSEVKVLFDPFSFKKKDDREAAGQSIRPAASL